MNDRRIVVGVDGSPASIAALEFAVRRARDTGSSVLAVSVCRIQAVPPSSVPLPVTGPVDVFRGRHLEELRTAMDQVDVTGVRVDQLAPYGQPGPVLVALAEGAQALVVGGHGYRKGPLSVIGSVTAYCLRHAECPVIVVPAEGERHEHGSRVSTPAQEFR